MVRRRRLASDCQPLADRGLGGEKVRMKGILFDPEPYVKSQDKIFYAETSGDHWREVFGVVETPEGASRLVILLGVSGRTTRTT